MLDIMATLEGRGGRLREQRERNILTLQELSELSGIHYTTISKLEAGVATARPSTVRKLAKALGVTPQYLRGISDHPLSEDTSGRPLPEPTEE
jgi:transcriptional regulator with XRE-family HTH domain